jgi:hypothetical protein
MDMKRRLLKKHGDYKYALEIDGCPMLAKFWIDLLV